MQAMTLWWHLNHLFKGFCLHKFGGFPFWVFLSSGFMLLFFFSTCFYLLTDDHRSWWMKWREREIKRERVNPFSYVESNHMSSDRNAVVFGQQFTQTSAVHRLCGGFLGNILVFIFIFPTTQQALWRLDNPCKATRSSIFAAVYTARHTWITYRQPVYRNNVSPVFSKKTTRWQAGSNTRRLENNPALVSDF